MSEVERFVGSLQGVAQIGVASYATGECDMTSRWHGIAVATSPGNAVYIVLPGDAEQRRQMVTAIAPLFQSSTTVVVSHDVKREMILLRREG